MTIALSLNPFPGCENVFEDLTNVPMSTKSEIDAVNLVNKFYQDNLLGNFYSSRQLLGKPNKDFIIPAYDYMAVMDSYKILKSKIIGDSFHIFVEYKYIGVHKGNEFYFYDSQNSENKITAKYIVQNGVMKNGRRPFTHRELYKSHLKNALKENEKVIVNCKDEFKLKHFIRKTERYNRILELLS